MAFTTPTRAAPTAGRCACPISLQSVHGGARADNSRTRYSSLSALASTQPPLQIDVCVGLCVRAKRGLDPLAPASFTQPGSDPRRSKFCYSTMAIRRRTADALRDSVLGWDLRHIQPARSAALKKGDFMRQRATRPRDADWMTVAARTASMARFTDAPRVI